MVDVGGNNGPATGHFVAHEFRLNALTQSDKLHFRGDLAALGVVHLSDKCARFGPQRFAAPGKAHAVEGGIRFALPPVLGGRLRQLFDIVALQNPLPPLGRQALPDIDLCIRVGIGAAGVVELHCRVGIAQLNLAHRHLDVGSAPGDVHFPRGRNFSLGHCPRPPLFAHKKTAGNASGLYEAMRPLHPYAGITQVRFKRSVTAWSPSQPGSPSSRSVFEPYFTRLRYKTQAFIESYFFCTVSRNVKIFQSTSSSSVPFQGGIPFAGRPAMTVW